MNGQWRRRRRVIQGVGLATVCWLVVAVAALFWPPLWPTARPIILSVHGEPMVIGHISTFEAWRNQVDFFLVSYFLYLKAWLMFRRSRFYDRLGSSVIVVNAVFAVLYEVGVAFALWPTLQKYRWGREIITDLLLVVVLWGFYELLRSEDSTSTIPRNP
jgi:hypothetical protein